MCNYQSRFNMVISVLSILTTSLIGWQIYSLINIHHIKKNLNNIIDERFKDYSNHVEALANAEIAKIHKSSYHLLNAIGYKTNSYISKHDLFEQNLRSINKALGNLNNCTIKDSAPYIYAELSNTIKLINDDISELNNIKCETLNSVINRVLCDNSNFDNIDKIEIVSKLMDLKAKLEIMRNPNK